FAPRDNAQAPSFEARDGGHDAPRGEHAEQDSQDRRSGQGYNRSRQRPSRDNPRGPTAQGANEAQAPRQPREPREQRQPRQPREPRGEGYNRFDDQPPRPNAHLGTQAGNPSRAPRSNTGGQPDPTRTSIDLMMERPRGGGGFRGGNGGGFRGGNGGGNGGGGGFGGNRRGGGGFNR
ncbi:MAG: RNA helicase, partial [Comamonas sp.]|nr:RNA helicase [Comamonas sp.]